MVLLLKNTVKNTELLHRRMGILRREYEILVWKI
jgi:hypothetical protein